MLVCNRNLNFTLRVEVRVSFGLSVGVLGVKMEWRGVTRSNETFKGVLKLPSSRMSIARWLLADDPIDGWFFFESETPGSPLGPAGPTSPFCPAFPCGPSNPIGPGGPKNGLFHVELEKRFTRWRSRPRKIHAMNTWIGFNFFTEIYRVHKLKYCDNLQIMWLVNPSQYSIHRNSGISNLEFLF